MNKLRNNSRKGVRGFIKLNNDWNDVKFRQVYSSIIARCESDTHLSYRYYGGRGIKCLWKNFHEFKNDMYDSYIEHCNKYGKTDTSIDRIDSNKNYYKENCRWATKELQMNNRRNNKKYLIDGKLFSRKELSKIYNIHEQTLRKRLESGWSIYKAIKEPVKIQIKK